MKRIAILFFVFSVLVTIRSIAQSKVPNPSFTHADTLRGSVTPERAWWDVVHYAISVTPDFLKRHTIGTNEIKFLVLKPGKIMQIDLQEPMNITRVTWDRQDLSFKRNGNVFLLSFPHNLTAKSLETIDISFEGNPKVAVRPPWDGGWIFSTDSLGRPWMSVACEGLGASVWYPCKDHLSDEPDSGASLSITVPDTLVAVGNGRLKDTQHHDNGTITYNWFVVNPINNYDIIPYIGKYVTWHEDYAGEKGKLTCDYWVLDYNLARAKLQFTQADSMLRCFEYWMGPYPFYEDGYKLVQSPHLGMEHQSAVGYGNHFANGYLGKDLSGTGWGLKWDFIIVHESGHEWFGNNITCKDAADMWVHEGFTNYSETLYTDCQDGTEAGNDYCIGTRSRIQNESPVIGPYGVNRDGSGDMYYKGGNMLHTIRHIIDNDSLFRKILRGLNKHFYHQTVTSAEIEKYISTTSGKDLSKVFDQYLRNITIPILEYRKTVNGFSVRWTNCVKGFNMPLKITAPKMAWLHPTTEWQTISGAKEDNSADLQADRNFYITVKKL